LPKRDCPGKEGEDRVRVMNIMLGLVTPLLKSPRDLKRLIGMLQVTWPAIASEVDRADFIAMGALRLFRPGVYRAIRANPECLTGGAKSSANRPARDLPLNTTNCYYARYRRKSDRKCG
jgi:predicted KAP-like P-loop ATPase